MKNNQLHYYLLFPFFWLLFQQVSDSPTVKSTALNSDIPCGVHILPVDIATQSKSAKMDSDWAKHAANRSNFDLAKAPPYEVPVVFHIIHQNGNENLTEAQLQTALSRLNDAFGATGDYDIPDGVDTRISFCFAQRTPDNQPSTGIERIESPLTDMEIAEDDRQVKNLSRYDAEAYLNIWVVGEIRSEIYGDGLTGYSSLPSSHGNPFDGIMIEAGSMRSAVGTWVLIHEVGHYLGLYHTFRRGCSNDNCLENGDLICDTPPDNSTAGVPCAGHMNSCDTDTNSGWDFDSNDDTRNHMDYGNLECFNRFTLNQSERMHFFLETTRQSIANSAGCLRPCDTPVTVDFQQITEPIYAGEVVNFTGTATNAASYEWLLDGQLIGRDINLETFFFATGTYELTLIGYSADPSNCQEKRLSKMINVVCSTVADITIVPTQPLPGDTVYFNNNSQRAEQFEWYIDGELISMEEEYAQVFGEMGNYTIELRAVSDYCETMTIANLDIILPTSEPVTTGLGLPIRYHIGTKGYSWIDFRDTINSQLVDNIFVNFNSNYKRLTAYTDCGEPAFHIGNFQNPFDTTSNNDPPLYNVGLFDTNYQLIYAGPIMYTIDSTFARYDGIRLIPEKENQIIPVPNAHNEWYYIGRVKGVASDSGPSGTNSVHYSRIKLRDEQIIYDETDVIPLVDDDGGLIIPKEGIAVAPDPRSSQRLQLFVFGKQASGSPALFKFTVTHEGIEFVAKQPLEDPFFPSPILTRYYCLEASPNGKHLALLYQNTRHNRPAKLAVFPTNNINNFRHIELDSLLIEPTGITGGLSYRETITAISNDPNLPLQHLKYFSSTLAALEFSPDNRSLYIVGRKRPYRDNLAIPDYIGQIDFLSDEPTIRLTYGSGDIHQLNPVTNQYELECISVDCNTPLHFINDLESGFDGNFYFYRENSDTLFVLPDPNSRLPQNLLPHRVDFSTSSTPNVPIAIDENTGGYNQSDYRQYLFEEQIDGYNYLNHSETTFLITRTNCEQDCQSGGFVYLQLRGERLDSFNLTSCPTVINYCLDNTIAYDLYDSQTDILLENVLSGGSPIYPPNRNHFNFLDRFSCGEICDNELDDDGDGLVDCFDGDCCGDGSCGDFYTSENCAQEGCYIELSPQEEELSFRVSMANNYSASGDLISFSGAPVVGDIDGDGFNEIVVSPHPILIDATQEYFSILETEEEPYALKKIPTPVYSNSTQLAIADLDRNGRSEILLHTATSPRNVREWNGISLIDRIVAYEVTDDGAYEIKWVSTERLRNFSPPINEISFGQTVGVADFNQDGIPEVYSGDNVVIQTINGSWTPILNELNHNEAGDFFGNVRSVAADVLPVSADCTGCNGLELIIGNLVIAFDIDKSLGEAINVQVMSLPNVEKGWTSIADVDADGDLDALISTFHPIFPAEPGGKLTYWDIQNSEETSKVVFNENNSNRIATQPVIGDIVGDDQPEIVIQRDNHIVAYRYTTGFEEVWRVPFQPDRGVHPMVLFDFNADQKMDIITQTSLIKLEILNGINGTSLYEFPLSNSFRAKLPVVADIDRDGETEILLTSLTSFGSINVLEAANDQVIPLARPVWNQRNWHNTQIADDLTVPLELQAGHLLPPNTNLNSFGAMHGQYQVPVSDMTVEILNADCLSDVTGNNVELKICNQGELSFPANSTLNARWQYETTAGNWEDIEAPRLGTTMFLHQAIAAGECITQPFNFSALPVQNFLNQDIQLRLVAGVNIHYEFGAHLNTDNISTLDLIMIRRNYDLFIPECDFTNNTDTVNFGLIKHLNLPADTLVCANESITLNAGSGFLEYRWNDGSRDSILSANTKSIFWVTVVDSCYFSQTDTIRVDYLPSTILDLSDTLISCDNAPILIEMDNFVASQWFPSTYLDCDTCTTVTIQPDEEIEYIVVGETVDGCYSVDTLQILKANSVETFIDTFVCIGATLFYENEELQPNQSYEYLYETITGCDSTVYINVIESDNAPYYENIDVLVCENDTTYVENSPFAAGDTAVFQYQTMAGCDSVLTYYFLSKPTYETTETRMLCAGDSTLVFGNYMHESGIYSETFIAGNSCDSIHSIQVEVLVPLIINLQINAPCPNENDGEIIAQVSGGLPPYKYNWSNGINNQPQISDLSDGNFSLTVIDDNGCKSQIATTLDYFATFNFSIQKTDITCFAATDGSIEISANKDLEISLDGENYTSQTAFQNLAGGNYILFVRDENGCLLSEPFTIHEPDELIVEIPFQQELQMGDSIQLSAITNSDRDLIYNWQPTTGLSCTDCPNPIARPLKNTTYELQVVDNQGCIAYTQTRFIVNEQVPIYIPTAFSPNDDGRNDHWEVFSGIGVERIISINIFNRWGAEVFGWKRSDSIDETMILSPKWDGIIRGQRAATGVYVYSIAVQYVDGRREVLRGDFLLLR